MPEFAFGSQPFLVGALTAILFFHVVWIFAYAKKRNDYADVAWGIGFPVSGWAAFAWTYLAQDRTDWNLRTLVVCTLITIWGLRLFVHIGMRNLSHDKEDARYAKWRQEWGDTQVWRSYVQVFLLQGIILVIVNLPVLWIIASGSRELDVYLVGGTLIWLIGFIFESVGDAQLRAFTKNPANKGKLIESGLWKYSRHPNYFGEVFQWWGVYAIALGVPGGWMTVVSPLAITFLILKVSGVPMLEEQMKSRPGFKDYQRRVAKFFPRPPRS